MKIGRKLREMYVIVLKSELNKIKIAINERNIN